MRLSTPDMVINSKTEHFFYKFVLLIFNVDFLQKFPA